MEGDIYWGPVTSLSVRVKPDGKSCRAWGVSSGDDHKERGGPGPRRRDRGSGVEGRTRRGRGPNSTNDEGPSPTLVVRQVPVIGRWNPVP